LSTVSQADDKVALVTGASRGIGRAIACRLAVDGWHVVLASRNAGGLAETEHLITDAGGRAQSRLLDVTDPAQITRLADDLARAGMTPAALINNSGIGGPSKPLWEVQPREWDEAIAVNLTGVYLCCRAFLPAMISRGHGSVINIGSVTGKNPLLHRSPYAASKAALIGLTKTLAADAGPHGIRVNLVSPGAVSGERLNWVITSRAEALGVPDAEVRERLAADSALKRFAEPEEVADAVAFLAGDASTGVTGIDLTVAAGFVMN
jgi:NAD(P)-dependent dehydrogenase (short-subunit alcohol dehydrogenase family)